jgi:hypothetical protein
VGDTYVDHRSAVLFVFDKAGISDRGNGDVPVNHRGAQGVE